MSEPLDLLVVGAGLCGLSAAWRARLAGRSVEVVEAGGRPGGVLRTDPVDGYRLERAAAAFPSSAKNLLALHATLPAPPPIRRPPPESGRQWILERRGLVEVPRTPPALAVSRLLPVSARVRLFSEALRGARRTDGPETAAAFVRRRFGAAVADGLLAPMTLGVYGTSPHDLGAGDAFPALVAAERTEGSLLRLLARRRGAPREIWTFEDGMEALPRSLAAALGPAVRLRTAVTDLEPLAGGVRARLSDGREREARAVVLATPADVQARLVARLSRAASETLGAVRTVPIAVVSLGVDTGASAPVPPGFGFLRGRDARVRILGCAFASAVDGAAPPGRTLLRAFLGGGLDPGALDLDDAEAAHVVERDLEVALGGRLRVDFADVFRHPRAIPVFSPGHRARMSSAASLLSPFGVLLSGSHVTGVGVDSCCR